MGKFGCNLEDYQEKILTPLIGSVQKAEELRGMVSLSIDEQELFDGADIGKSTIEKIKSRENLFLNGSNVLKIDDSTYTIEAMGLIDLSNPFNFNHPHTKVCFGEPEICDDITSGTWMFFPWFLTKIVVEKKARIVLDQFELKISIYGDLGFTLDKIIRDETFQADMKYQIDSDDSYLRINYRGKTSPSKFSSMMEEITGPNIHGNYENVLEYFYNQATDIFATVTVDNTKYFQASGCSEDLCNDPKRQELRIKN